jgi:hypothetical protein
MHPPSFEDVESFRGKWTSFASSAGSTGAGSEELMGGRVYSNILENMRMFSADLGANGDLPCENQL